MDMKPLLNRRDLADLFSVSTDTIDRWAKSGTLPAPLRIGGVVRWSLDSITRWIDAKCPAGDPFYDDEPIDQHDLRLDDVCSDRPIVTAAEVARHEAEQRETERFFNRPPAQPIDDWRELPTVNE